MNKTYQPVPTTSVAEPDAARDPSRRVARRGDLPTRTTVVAFLALTLPSLALGQAATDVDCAQCVDTKDIAGFSISTKKLQANSVTSEKIRDGEVQTQDIADFSISTKKLKGNSVTSGKIADGAVTLDKVAPELSNAIGTFCLPGETVVGMDANGNFVCEAPVGAWTAFAFPTGGSNIENDCSGGAKYIKRSDFSPYFYVGAQLCSDVRYKLFLATAPGGIYWEIADGSGFGSDHCELIGGTEATAIGTEFESPPLPSGFFRSNLGQAFEFASPPGQFEWRTSYYECGISIP